MITSLWIACALLLPPGETSPWDFNLKASNETARKLDGAGDDPAKLVEYARWCVECGLYADALVGLAKLKPLSDDAAKFLRVSDVANPRSYDELAQFADAPTWKPPVLTALSDKQRQDLVRSRMRGIRQAIQSSYFDLWSDLGDPELKPYSLEMNGYYRAFKNRFSAYEPGNIDVLLFRNRSDYLFNYAVRTGWTGESILGYYRPDLQQLVFYHDPRNQTAVFETARHECTHLLIDQCFHRAPLPKWFHEGMACYFGVGGLDAKGQHAASYVAALMRSLRAKKRLDLKRLFAREYKDFSGEDYPWAWSVIHFANAGRYQNSFPQFLKKLREKLEPDKDKDPLTVAQASKLCADVFRETITTDDEAFAYEWLEYFTKAFRFDRPDQLVDLGTACIESAQWATATVDRDELLEIGRRALAASPPQLDADLLARRHLAQARFATISARDRMESMGAMRLALRSVLDHLAAVPLLVDEAKRAAIVRDAFLAVRAFTQSSLLHGQTSDLRAALKKHTEEGAKEPAEAKAVVVLVDELEEHAFGALARALNADPLDVDAAEQWLWLAIEAAPTRIPDIVPTLLLLNAADPSDRHRAMLGVAYMALGKPNLGKRWVDEGRWLSAGPNQMQPYLDFAGLKFADDGKQK